MDMHAVEETVMADWTLSLGGVALANQPSPKVFWERMPAAIMVNGVMKVLIGTEDPVWGEMVQPTLKTHFCSSATDARDGPNGPRVPQHGIHFKLLRGSQWNAAHLLAGDSCLRQQLIMHIPNPNQGQDL